MAEVPGHEAVAEAIRFFRGVGNAKAVLVP
jgi:hypothetical protein